MPKPLKRLILIPAILALLPLGAGAAGSELHIYATGDVHLIAANVATKHALNLLSVTVWGQKWLVPIDRFTKIESSDGLPINLEEILEGHLLEIKGRPGAKTNSLDTRLIRDLSIGSGALAPPPPPAGAALPSSSPLPPPPPPAPLAATTTVGRLLTQDLEKGMRGGDVISLQEFLQKRNWGIPNNGPVTGYFGSVTAAAVAALQRAYDLPPTGIVGPRTRAVINKILAQ